MPRRRRPVRRRKKRVGMSGAEMVAHKKATGKIGGRYAGMEMPYSAFLKKKKLTHRPRTSRGRRLRYGK